MVMDGEEGAGEGPKHQNVPSTNVSCVHDASVCGLVLTDAVPQAQRDTIHAKIMTAHELKEIRAVMCNMATLLCKITTK